jgi:hypothetical protein
VYRILFLILLGDFMEHILPLLHTLPIIIKRGLKLILV